MRKVKKLLKYLLFFLLFVIVLVVGTGYYFLNTKSGLEQAISLSNRYSGYNIEVGEISGRLWQKTELRNVAVTGDGLDMTSGLIVLDWQPQKLWDYRMEVAAIEVKDTEITLQPSKIEEPEETKQPLKIELPDINLPIAINIEDVSVNNLVINNPATQKPALTVDDFELGIDYVKQRGEIHTFKFLGEGVDLNMTGHIVTKGDYPIELNNKTSYQSTVYGSQIVEATINGALKKQLAINIKGEGLSQFTLEGTLASLTKQPTFDVDVELKNFDAKQLGLPNTKANAEISAKGSYDLETSALLTDSKGVVTYFSPDTDGVRLTYEAKLYEKELLLPTFTVDLLTANQQFSGTGVYGLAEGSLDFKLGSSALSWPQTDENPAVVARDLQMAVTGTIDDYQLDITTNIDTQAVGVVPLTIGAQGNQEQLNDSQIQALVNNQPLTITGKAAWQPQINYQLTIAAKDIEPFKEFPGLKDVLLIATGDDKTYQVDGNGYVYSKNIAPSDFNIAVKGSPTQLEKALIKLDTLGGNVTAVVAGDLAPLNITADLTLADIQPQTFYQGVDANIQSAIHAHVSQNDDKLLAVTEIKQLSGSLQKQPLSGSGKIIYDQVKAIVDVQALSLNLAGNKIDANGLLAADPFQGTSNLSAKIDAKQLGKLLPELSGAIQGNVVAKGSLNAPEITAKLNGSKLNFQQQQVAKIAAEVDVSLANDKLSIVANASGVRLGENKIDRAKITTTGKISSHTLNVDIRSPKKSSLPSVNLAAKGGLNQGTMTWKGVLNKLGIDSALAGKWSTPVASQLSLSAKEATVNKLCLRQQSATLCANGKMVDQTGQFTVNVKGLATKQFAHMMPKTVNVNTVLGGNAIIDLNNGKPTVKGKIAAKGGKLQLSTGSGGLTSKIKQFETLFALKNNRVETIVNTQLSKIGKIKLTADMPDIGKQNIRANVKLDSKDLRFIEEIVPLLSGVRGRLNGDMSVSGNPAKQLKITGKVNLQKTQFNVPKYGTEIRDLTLTIFAKNGNSLGFKGGAKAGSGRFTLNGSLNPTSKKGQINIKGKNFQVANSKKLQVAISPDLKIVFSDNIKVRGDIVVPKALIVPESSGSKITASEDVVLPKKKKKKKAASSPVDAEITIKLGDDVRVASADIETRLKGGIKVKAKPHKSVEGSGVVEIQSGELRVYGQLLNIERGRVIFNGPLTNPSLDIRTSREVDDVVVGASVLGTASTPEISLFSTPSMADSSILSYLLFGRPPNSESFSSTALLQTGGLVGANTLARGIRSSIGLDVLNFTLTGMEAGKNLSKKLYVGMRADFFKAINEFLVEYKFSSSLHLDGVFSDGEVSTDLIKIIETD